MLYFGVGEAIRTRLFSNPLFTKLRTTGREDNWYSSPDAASLNNKLGGKLFGDPSFSAYALGYDFAGLFNFKDHSTGLVFLRCEDLPSQERTKREYHVPLMIIPGPQQPTDLDAYFNLILTEMREYGPGGPGLVVSPVSREADGSLVRLPPTMHRVVLTTLYADTPARVKAGQFMKSASAYLACQFCWFAGEKANTNAQVDNNATLFLGYNQSVTASRGLLMGQALQIGVDDQARLLTNSQQRERARLVEGIKDEPDFDAGHYGCAGYSVFHKALPYIDYNNFFVLPFAHSVFLGVVKDFMRLVTGVLGRRGKAKDCCISYRGLRLIKEREQDYVLTSDFGRPLSSIVSKSGRYVIENWVRWVDVFSTYLLSKECHGEEVLPPQMKKAWGHLRRFILYHMRPAGEPFTQQACDEARYEFLSFCKIMEQAYPQSCKLNMHLLACRLHIQEQQRGSIYAETELWVERLVQLCKTKTRYRSTTQPELVAAKFLVTASALDVMSCRYPSVKTFDDWVPGYRSRDLQGEGVDAEDVPNKMLLQGRLASDGEWEVVREAVTSCVESNMPDLNIGALLYTTDPVNNNNVKVYVHTMCRINEEIITSAEHSRARTRESHHVEVRLAHLVMKLAL